MVRATTTLPSPMSVRRFANIWNAASSGMALQGRGVMTAGTTTLWSIPAKARASASRAKRDAWLRESIGLPKSSYGWPIATARTTDVWDQLEALLIRFQLSDVRE